MNVVGRIGRRLMDPLALAGVEDGQVLVEYAILIALVAIVCIGIVTTIGVSTSTLFSKIVASWP